MTDNGQTVMRDSGGSGGTECDKHESLKDLIGFSSVGIHLVFWPTAIIGAAADLWSKWAVFEWLASTSSRRYTVVEGFFYFVMRENTGAAFSIAQGQRVMLVSISVIAMVVLLGVIFFGKVQRKITGFAMGLMAAGIAGNLYDRIFNDGKVRDFIDIIYWGGRHWPAFNIADSMLCAAVGLIIISSFTCSSSQRPVHQYTEEPRDRPRQQ